MALSVSPTTKDELAIEPLNPLHVANSPWHTADFPGSTSVLTYASDGTERTILAGVTNYKTLAICEFRLAANNGAIITVAIYSDIGGVETYHWGGYFDAAAVAGVVAGPPVVIVGVMSADLKWKASSAGGAAIRPNIYYKSVLA